MPSHRPIHPVRLVIVPVAAAASRPGALDELDAAERDRLARLHRPADRLRFLAGRALLRELVAAHCGILPAAVRIVQDGRGRPRVVAPADAPDVSIAHAGGAVGVVLVDEGRVGLDLEPLQPTRDLELLALTPEERITVAGRPADRREAAALEAWTVKEAYAKLVGHGLCLDFTRLSLRRIAARPAVTLRTLVVPLADERYRAAVAVWSPTSRAGERELEVQLALPAADAARMAEIAA